MILEKDISVPAVVGQLREPFDDVVVDAAICGAVYGITTLIL